MRPSERLRKNHARLLPIAPCHGKHIPRPAVGPRATVRVPPGRRLRRAGRDANCLWPRENKRRRLVEISRRRRPPRRKRERSLTFPERREPRLVKKAQQLRGKRKNRGDVDRQVFRFSSKSIKSAIVLISSRSVMPCSFFPRSSIGLPKSFQPNFALNSFQTMRSPSLRRRPFS